MTPEQKIKLLILNRVAVWGAISRPEGVTSENIDALYDAANEDYKQDARYEVREGQFETGLSGPSSRHYESNEVAAQAPDGSWVGWTYWYGGGKYGEPEAVEWMNQAYLLDCVEEEKMVVVRKFAKTKVSA